MNEQFLRCEMLLGEAAMEKLAQSHVAVFGLGGVGSWAAEALARTGIGKLTLIDHDDVGLTNLNRQAQASHATIGQPKATALADRIALLAPDCKTEVIIGKYAAQGGKVLSLEPHLTKFVGLKDLEAETVSVVGSMHFESGDEAFDYAAKTLYGLVDSL